MLDFRLHVFYTVAKRLNFTRAAEELYISQPAVSKHIRELENYFKLKLFERTSSKIKLTEAGDVLLQNVEQLVSVHRDMEFEMNTLALRHKGKLKIGASTTVAQYLLPQILASFHKTFSDVDISLVTSNTEQVEHKLHNNNIDLGIIEGYSKNPVIKYTEFVKDEIVLVARVGNKLVNKQEITVEELKTIPLLLRESGSGTLEVIAHALKPKGVKIAQLNNEMQLGSTESIKQYLFNSDCFAFLSIHSILKELKNNELQIIDVVGLTINRFFYIIEQQGRKDALSELFIRFIKQQYINK